MDVDGALSLDVRDAAKVPAALRKLRIASKDGKVDYAEVEKVAANLLAVEPNLSTALIQPKAQSSYEDIISLMDSFKKNGLHDLGVAPL
jgi:biopolymer transport protein ExbD